MAPKAFVYKWTDESTGRWYIGSHKGHRKDYIGGGVWFRRAYNKRPQDFSREIIYESDYDSVLELEDFILKEINAKENPMSFNLKNEACGGNGGANKGLESKFKGVKRTDDVKKKISKSVSESIKGGKNPNSKSVYCEHLNSYFETIKECANALNVNKFTLYSQISGQTTNKYGVIKTNDL